eukprot:scaffold66743_cov38-Prasinocladus_malaysianus.AAC.1
MSGHIHVSSQRVQSTLLTSAMAFATAALNSLEGFLDARTAWQNEALMLTIVDFETELDLTPFVRHSPNEHGKPTRHLYTLYGVLVHAGHSVHSGHYYCFVRGPTGMWHAMDDDRVSQVSERVVLGQRAYILFYIRQQPPNHQQRKCTATAPASLANQSEAQTTANGPTKAESSPQRKAGIDTIAPMRGPETLNEPAPSSQASPKPNLTVEVSGKETPEVSPARMSQRLRVHFLFSLSLARAEWSVSEFFGLLPCWWSLNAGMYVINFK